MGIKAKQYAIQSNTYTNVVSASQITATVVGLFNVEGMFDFTVSLHCCATACNYPYVIQTAPVVTDSWFSNITATSIDAGTAGSVVKNTFEGNNQAWVRIVMTSASNDIAAGELQIKVTGNER